MRHFTYEQKRYELIGPSKFKHPETRKWIDAITYKDSKGAIFTRELQEFNNRFKEELK